RRAQLRLLERGRRGRNGAADAGFADARDPGRRPRLRHRHVRRADAVAAAGVSRARHAASGYAASTTYGPPPTDAREENRTKRPTWKGGERNGGRTAR